MANKFVSGATPLDYSPYGAPRQPAQRNLSFPDPTKVTEEKNRNRRAAPYLRSRARTERDNAFDRRKLGEPNE